MLLGGAGGGSNSDYQVVGALTYKWTPKWLLGAGWRYLDINYRPRPGGQEPFIYDIATTGLILRAIYHFK
jgi:hypothetical protein